MFYPGNDRPKKKLSSRKICVADLSGIQGIYFWIPDIVAQWRNNSGMTKLLAQQFRNDETAGATIPE